MNKYTKLSTINAVVGRACVRCGMKVIDKVKPCVSMALLYYRPRVRDLLLFAW